MRTLSGALIAGGLLLLGPGVSLVEAQVNSAVIEALVRDPDGRPLDGVLIVAVSPATGASAETLTGVMGTGRLPAVQPGTYEVHFSRQGRLPVVERDLTLRVGQTIVIHATMRAQLVETVEVVGAPHLLDVHKSDSSTNILPEQIEQLPVADRDFQRLAFIAPTVQRERGEFRFISGGPVLGGGGNASQQTILVDGVDFTDPALGLATARFSQDAIREFRVISNRFDAEIGGSAGGALSIVTRSGTNNWSGGGFGFFRDDALRAQGALEQGKLPYSRRQVGGLGGGPLAINKSHVFLSLEQVNEQNITLFRPGGAFVGQAADIQVPIGQTLAFGRVDHQLRPKQRLAVKVVYERFRQDHFRVGGIQDTSYGQKLNRDNANVNVEHNWTIGAALNQIHVQAAWRKYFEPRDSTSVGEWFSSGNTLRTGGNILGDLLGQGTILELRDTYFRQRGAHFLRLGGAVQHVRDRSRIEFYPSGLFIYVTDSRALPLAYAFGDGSADVTASTTRLTGYAQDDWAVRPNARLSVGVRYDLDTKGNNPDFRHPLVPEGRTLDTNNIQPRAAFSWDTGGDGRHVLRGGAGLFTGRYLLTPLFQEKQQNGVTGRVVQTRVNGALVGLPALALDPAHPRTSGIAQKADISIMAATLNAPMAAQVSGGYTARLGKTGLYADIEAIYISGRDEIMIRDTNFRGNQAPGRPNPAFNQINTYTNDGRSRYAALVMSLNGALRGGHLVTASYTLGRKMNIADDFSPELPSGFPNDPANVEAEYGRARSDERHHVVMTGVFRMHGGVTVAPILEYGSGQPWTHRLGYDFNGDGRNSDRPAGVARFDRDGPSFKQLSVRVTKTLRWSGTRFDCIVEAFNLFNARNDNVAAIDGAEFLSGPTLVAPATPVLANPNFGRATATLPSREVQLGIRWTF